jgi:hypothetical protein
MTPMFVPDAIEQTDRALPPGALYLTSGVELRLAHQILGTSVTTVALPTALSSLPPHARTPCLDCNR